MVKYGVWISKKLTGAVFAVLMGLILATVPIPITISGITTYAFAQDERSVDGAEVSDIEAPLTDPQEIAENANAALNEIDIQAETALSVQASTQELSDQDVANAQVPADVVPPYGHNYRGPNIQPLFKLSQTTTWIIFILLSLLAILLFTWFLIKRVKEATAIRKNQSESIFQANNDTYRFDDDETAYAKAEETAAHSFIDDPLSDEMEEASVVILNEEHEEADERDNDQDLTDEDPPIDDENLDAQKNGFLSRLFSGNRDRAVDGEDPLFVNTEFSDEDTDEDHSDMSQHDQDEIIADNGPDHIIDVDPEPIMDDAAELEPVYIEDDDISNDSYFPQSDLPVPDAVPDFTPDLEREYRTEADLSIQQSDMPAFEPHHIMSAPTPEVRDNPEGDSVMPTEIIKTLETLEVKQAESSQSINTLAQQLAEQQEGVKSELSAIRTEANQFQSQIDRNLDNKFAAFSTSVKSEIQRNEEKVALKNSQGNEMNNEELKLKLLELDKKVINQSKITEMNFHSVIQKLESISAPQPQLNKLATDTSELKSQMSLLLKTTKQQSASPAEPIVNPEALKEREINNEILRKLDASLNEQGRNLSDFREENRALAKKFDRLNDRIDRMETDLQSQRSSLIEVLERYNHKQENYKTHASSEPVTIEKPEATQIDALGIITPVEAKPDEIMQIPQNQPHENGSDYAPLEQNNTDADLFSSHQDESDTDDSPDGEPKITPVLFSIDEPKKPIPALHDYSDLKPKTELTPNTKPAQGEDTERKIRPLTFNMSTMSKSHTDR